ncbi:MAG: hypothetical protein JEZ09_04730 [Salinivirgaceae bacterium]|nr:hypothetical protein [Salinivirgaceae bacterium]
MMTKILYSLILLVAILSSSCTKDESKSDGTGNVTIESLIADDTVLNVWVPTKITVTASGDELIYNWEADHGELNGSGSQVEYMAGTCCTGINTITCTVANSTKSDSKQIKIRILPFK